MNKTRIKIQTRKNGSQLFYPQYKKFGIWWSFQEMHYGGPSTLICWDLEAAQKAIDRHVREENEHAGRKVVTTQYVKYP